VAGQADVIVVGGGHNGLICAAYLARAGIDTLVLEARPEVGGCASTVTDLGARFNICHCDHTLIRGLPVIDELELEAHGLHYLEAAANNIYLFHDQSPPWVHFHDIEATMAGLASLYPHQVGAYRRYLADALPVARLVLDLAATHPTGPRLSATALSRRGDAALRLVSWARRSVDDVLSSYFDDWHLRLPAISLGPTVWGVPPTRPGTGLATLGYATVTWSAPAGPRAAAACCPPPPGPVSWRRGAGCGARPGWRACWWRPGWCGGYA
jgi:phytoene dehydrogenase-like protein